VVMTREDELDAILELFMLQDGMVPKLEQNILREATRLGHPEPKVKESIGRLIQSNRIVRINPQESPFGVFRFCGEAKNPYVGRTNRNWY